VAWDRGGTRTIRSEGSSNYPLWRRKLAYIVGAIPFHFPAWRTHGRLSANGAPAVAGNDGSGLGGRNWLRPWTLLLSLASRLSLLLRPAGKKKTAAGGTGVGARVGDHEHRLCPVLQLFVWCWSILFSSTTRLVVSPQGLGVQGGTVYSSSPCPLAAIFHASADHIRNYRAACLRWVAIYLTAMMAGVTSRGTRCWKSALGDVGQGRPLSALRTLGCRSGPNAEKDQRRSNVFRLPLKWSVRKST